MLKAFYKLFSHLTFDLSWLTLIFPTCELLPWQGVKLIFTGGHISLTVAFKGPNAILGLYKCNYSLTVKRELGAATG